MLTFRAALSSLLQTFVGSTQYCRVLTTDTAQALTVSFWLQGFGGMGLSSSYSTNMVPEDQALAVIHRAKKLGITLMVRLLTLLGVTVLSCLPVYGLESSVTPGQKIQECVASELVDILPDGVTGHHCVSVSLSGLLDSLPLLCRIHPTFMDPLGGMKTSTSSVSCARPRPSHDLVTPQGYAHFRSHAPVTMRVPIWLQARLSRVMPVPTRWPPSLASSTRPQSLA